MALLRYWLNCNVNYAKIVLGVFTVEIISIEKCVEKLIMSLKFWVRKVHVDLALIR